VRPAGPRRESCDSPNQVTAYVLSARGDVEGAARAVERMEQMLSTDRPVERSQLTVARLVTLVRRDERKSEWPHISHEIAVAMDATGQTWIKVCESDFRRVCAD